MIYNKMYRRKRVCRIGWDGIGSLCLLFPFIVCESRFFIINGRMASWTLDVLLKI